MHEMNAKKFPIDFIRFASTVAPEIELYSSKDRDGKKIYIYDAKLISILAKYFGVRYEILTPPDGQLGARLPDGNWSGIIGMALREEVDLAMTGIAVTEERFSVVSYSSPYYYSAVSFMTEAPQPMPKNLAILYPFSPALWTAIAGLMVAMSLVFYSLLDRRKTYQRVLLSTFRSTLENAVDFKMARPAVKMAALTWILGMFVITNAYKAVLLSFLSFPTMIGIRDISGLSRAAASESFKCFTFPGSYVVRSLLKSDEPAWRAIGECLERNEKPGNPLKNFAVAPSGKAYVGSKIMALPYERRYFVSRQNFFIEQYGMPISKTFCCAEDLNLVIQRLLAAGIFEKFSGEMKFLVVLKNPSLQPEYAKAVSVISLGDMSGAFYILMSGWVAGFVTFLIEIFIYKSTVHG